MALINKYSINKDPVKEYDTIIQLVTLQPNMIPTSNFKYSTVIYIRKSLGIGQGDYLS